MYTHPYISLQIARDRQRELIAQADQHRMAREMRDLARASRSAAKRPQLRAWRAVLRLRTPASA
jgi:hypothetical protein